MNLIRSPAYGASKEKAEVMKLFKEKDQGSHENQPHIWNATEWKGGSVLHNCYKQNNKDNRLNSSKEYAGGIFFSVRHLSI